LVGILIIGVGAATGFSSADGGTTIVVRNGGLLDDTSYNQTIQSNSGLTYTGLWSTDHPYPASQRYFTVSSAPGADSNEVINVPTKDGVNIGIEGTFYFQLSTDPTVLEDFDNKFGTRTFPDSNGEQVHAWDENGWSPFLNATLGNVVQNALRTEIGKVKCQDLQASCALAFNASATIDPNADQSASTISSIQAEVNKSFANDVKDYLGGEYFTGIQFVLSKPTLPQGIQDSINASFAKVAEQAGITQQSQGKLQQAEIDAQTNAKKQEGYNNCPACAQQDILKSIPGSITVWAPGGDAAVAVQSPPAG
jgi:hypothetical protein